MKESVFIGLGSNVGAREENLDRAVDALSRIDAAQVLHRSSLYDSAPFGPPQPRYLNAVVQIDCALEPAQLLTILKQIERDGGRTQGPAWAPRPIDLDILIWAGRRVAQPELQIPHPELHKRRFVLEPLCELAPQLAHPVLGVTVTELLAKLSAQDVVRVSSPRWPQLPEEHAR